MRTIGSLLLIAGLAAPCVDPELASVLGWGQKLVHKHHCVINSTFRCGGWFGWWEAGIEEGRRLQAREGSWATSCGGRGCAGCAELMLPTCNGGTPRCSSLGTLLAEESPVRPRVCGKHQHECSPPHGRCEQGRCICDVAPLKGLSRGGEHCEVDNVARAVQTADSRYDESVYKMNYDASLSRLNSSISDSASYGSGSGSSLSATLGIRTAIPHLVEMLQIKTILDAPCGDFNYFREILKDPKMAGVSY